MPEPLDQKRRRVYNHFLKIMATPDEYPMLYRTLANNACGYSMCRTPNDPNDMNGGPMKKRIEELEQRLVCIEAKINRLAYMADLRMTLTEQRQDLLCKVLVKLTKPQK